MTTSNDPKNSSPITGPQPDLTAKDPYLILGLPKTATQVEIKRAYFTLIRQYPPETDSETFKIVRGAYEKIKDATRRAETDIFLPQPPPEWKPSKIKLALDTSFHASDVLLALRNWGDLGRSDFSDDFREIDL